jgi:trehalose 6-phosphate phosphatase
VIPILSPAAADVIEQISRNRTLLAFDFDGTLAPMVPDRAAAALRDSTRALLRTVALLYPCAVVSGRTRADATSRLADVPLVAIIGNHGAEPGFGPVDRRLETRVADWRRALAARLAGVDGVEIEDKRLSLALHYRGARSRDDAERAIARAVAPLEAARTFSGHAVVNVVPDEAPTKGDAMLALCARLGARIAVYVGDDCTDEEAFRSDVVSISVRIGESSRSSARYCLPAQEDVDDLLGALVATRARQDGLGERWQGLVRAAGEPAASARTRRGAC